jgi:hypothetical protein
MKLNCDVRRLKRRLLGTVSDSLGPLSFCMSGMGIAGLLVVSAAGSASAMNLYDGSASGNNLEINLTTTLSYTGIERVNNPSAILTGPANNNGSEGDLNFQHGIAENLFEVLPVLDIRDGDFGAHFSGEAYLNTVYLQKNQNDQPGTFNPLSTTDNQSFTSATRNVDGENARLLDAFVYGGHTFADDQQISLKFGRQTLLWGQSLFFTNNGIAAGQAPIDIITADNLANPEAQQVFLPVGQAVINYRPGIGSLTFQAYYQFEYMHDVFQGVGAYFNSSDILDKGGQRIIAGTGAYLLRTKDLTPPNQNGQFGVAVQDTFGNYDVGLYGLRYDSKAPEIYAFLGQGAGTPTPGGVSVGNYRLVYPRDIQLYGASVSTTIGPANVAGEISGRIHMPLVAGGFGIPSAGNPGNANSDPLYPVGDTIAGQASAIYVSPGIPLDPGGVSVDGEVEFNHLVTVTANRAALAQGRQGSAAAFEVVLTPTYYDVLPNLQLGFPIGITYNVLGNSEIDGSMQHGTGAFTLGVTATYKETWVAAVTYKDYLGAPNASFNGLADRGYVSLNLQHSF